MTNPPSQQFSIQFVVLRDGEPITEIITVNGWCISLHAKHDRAKTWAFQATALAALVEDHLKTKVDGLAGIILDNRRVGLEPVKAHPVLEAVGVPILKRINRTLARLINKLNGVS